MRHFLSTTLAGAVLGLVLALSHPAAAIGLDPAYSRPLLGPQHAQGVVVWSHGRSIDSEDSEAPSPPYLEVLRDSGWDVMRFDRLRDGDTLPDSTRRLVDHVSALKHAGYRRIVLAGQSFGAFLALMAADASDQVDAVVATAPAAFGSFDDFYDSWDLNGTRLYPLLERIKRARVMLFYFHGDDFDPGGRGSRSRAILSQRGLGYEIIDQPAYLVGHWAASTGLFLRRFGTCVRDFAEADRLDGELACRPSWGQAPSVELKLPDDLTRPQPAAAAEPASNGAATAASGGGKMPEQVLDSWYGFYPNGREMLLAIEAAHAKDLIAIYAIGPSVDNAVPATWTRRDGHIVDGEFVFEESGKSTLRFRPNPDGGMAATWVSADGKSTMSARMRRINPLRLARSEEAPDGQSPDGQFRK